MVNMYSTSNFRLKLCTAFLTLLFSSFNSSCDSLIFLVSWTRAVISNSTWTISRILSLLCGGSSVAILDQNIGWWYREITPRAKCRGCKKFRGWEGLFRRERGECCGEGLVHPFLHTQYYNIYYTPTHSWKLNLI